MWAVYPMGCRQLAPRALEVSCDPRYIRSVVRPAWNGCWPVEWSIPGQGGRGGMGWGQFGWRGSQDRSPTVNHRLKKKKKKVPSSVLEENLSTPQGCPHSVRASAGSPLCLPDAVYAWGSARSGTALRPACVRLSDTTLGDKLFLLQLTA